MARRGAARVRNDSEGYRPLHRLFGLFLLETFQNSPIRVIVEPELNQPQRLDAMLIRRGPGPIRFRLPDGLDPLAPFNLFTFKSLWEPLDPWALKELNSYFVLTRKQESPSTKDLLPEGDFRLYAVCSRYPHNLANSVPFERVQPGVYDCRWATDTVRVIVVADLPEEEHNTPLQLFSTKPEVVAAAAERYRERSEQAKSLVLQLTQNYYGRGIVMPYTMEDFNRDFRKNFVKDMTPEQRLNLIKDMTPEQRFNLVKDLPPAQRRDLVKDMASEQRLNLVKDLPPEERLNLVKDLPPAQRRDLVSGLTPEERLADLAPEQRLAGLPPEQILASLTEEQRSKLIEHLSAKASSAPKKRGKG